MGEREREREREVGEGREREREREGEREGGRSAMFQHFKHSLIDSELYSCLPN